MKTQWKNACASAWPEWDVRLGNPTKLAASEACRHPKIYKERGPSNNRRQGVTMVGNGLSAQARRLLGSYVANSMRIWQASPGSRRHSALAGWTWHPDHQCWPSVPAVLIGIPLRRSAKRESHGLLANICRLSMVISLLITAACGSGSAELGGGGSANPVARSGEVANDKQCLSLSGPKATLSGDQTAGFSAWKPNLIVDAWGAKWPNTDTTATGWPALVEGAANANVCWSGGEMISGINLQASYKSIKYGTAGVVHADAGMAGSSVNGPLVAVLRIRRSKAYSDSMQRTCSHSTRLISNAGRYAMYG